MQEKEKKMRNQMENYLSQNKENREVEKKEREEISKVTKKYNF
jgi:hypothetical protein